MAAVEVTELKVEADGRWAAIWTRVARAVTARGGVFALAGIVLGSFAYRLYVARICSLWLDEVNTYVDSFKSWPVVLEGSTREQPPLMYVVVKAVSAIFGTSDAGIRAVSLFFGCVLLVAAYELCLELGLTVGRSLLVVATLALSPFFIRHATEARQYAMVSALVTLATTRALRLLRGRVRVGDLVGFVGCASAGAYTHYFGLGYAVALLATVTIGIAPAWRQSSLPRRGLLVGMLSLLAVVLWFIAKRAASLAQHYAVGHSGARAWPAFNLGLMEVLSAQFSFLANVTWSFWIEPYLALVGIVLLSWRLRGFARLLPLGLGLSPCVGLLFISAEHFIAPRYVAPSAIWYHLGACVALFAAFDRLRGVLPRVGRAALLAPLVAGLALFGVLGARFHEYPVGFGAGIEDYRGLQRYFLKNLAGDTALVGYFGSYGELFFGKVYPIGSRPIRLENFRPVPGIDHYLVVEIHVDHPVRRRRLEALVAKKFGLSVEEWRSLPLLPLPHSIYQSAVHARIVTFRGDPKAQQPKKRRPRHPPETGPSTP
ncbi:MAG: glycosyltransferase family 39 protein [Polyangiaceae bacterium]